MSLVLTAEPLPLVADADGVVRVAKTRVTLDTIVAAFNDGLTAEEVSELTGGVGDADVGAECLVAAVFRPGIRRSEWAHGQVRRRVQKG